MTKILIVDDEKINSTLLKKRLLKRDFDVELVHSGQDCLNYLNKDNKAIVLLDLVMPEMDGLEVLIEIRKKWQQVETPVIMLSANDDVSKIVDCLNHGASDYIIKPANIDIASARINIQLKLQSLYYENLRKKELAAINSMIITFNHEINSPLTVALSVLSKKHSKLTDEKIEKGLRSVNKIRDIVNKIEKIGEGHNIEQEEYVDGIKMIKIK